VGEVITKKFVDDDDEVRVVESLRNKSINDARHEERAIGKVRREVVVIRLLCRSSCCSVTTVGARVALLLILKFMRR
jgi:hypothetical protein